MMSDGRLDFDDLLGNGVVAPLAGKLNLSAAATRGMWRPYSPVKVHAPSSSDERV